MREGIKMGTERRKIKVKSCPFCGAYTEFETNSFGDSDIRYFRVRCIGRHGHALDRWEASEEEAAEIWNPRG